MFVQDSDEEDDTAEEALREAKAEHAKELKKVQRALDVSHRKLKRVRDCAKKWEKKRGKVKLKIKKLRKLLKKGKSQVLHPTIVAPELAS